MIGSTSGEATMVSDTIDELLKLPAADRIEIAMALLGSLKDHEQEAEFVLTPELKAELHRRIAEHDADPDSAIPWEEIERKHRALN
jgi:putative addiction module component (TIGR02574 family)